MIPSIAVIYDATSVSIALHRLFIRQNYLLIALQFAMSRLVVNLHAPNHYRTFTYLPQVISKRLFRENCVFHEGNFF